MMYRYCVDRSQPELFTEILNEAILLVDLKHECTDCLSLVQPFRAKGFQLLDLCTLRIVLGRIGTIPPHEIVLIHFLPGVFFYQPAAQFRDDFTFPDQTPYRVFLVCLSLDRVEKQFYTEWI